MRIDWDFANEGTPPASFQDEDVAVRVRATSQAGIGAFGPSNLFSLGNAAPVVSGMNVTGSGSVVALDLVNNVQDLSPQLGPGSTDQGQASAVMTTRMLAVPSSVIAPESAFEISRVGGADDSTTITISETGVTLEAIGMVLINEVLLFADHPTVADLASAIDALPEWSVTVLDASFDTRPSRSVFASGEHNAKGSDVPVRVWA